MSNTENISPDVNEDPGAAAPSPLQRERDDLYDRLLRATAEFDNYRKRTERERRDHSEYVAADVVRELLPILDDLERALSVPVDGAPGPITSYRSGIELIHRQFLEVLKRRGVEPLDVVGQKFDPEWHEAIGHETMPGFTEGHITSEVRRGYRLGTRLLRPAMVKVAS
jgi:molecular chaperone GrpE